MKAMKLSVFAMILSASAIQGQEFGDRLFNPSASYYPYSPSYTYSYYGTPRYYSSGSVTPYYARTQSYGPTPDYGPAQSYYAAPYAGLGCMPYMPPAQTRPAPRPTTDYQQPLPKSNMRQDPQRRAQNQPPKIIESRSLGAHAARKIQPTRVGELCEVGFWNITGHDVELEVSGKTITVPRDHAVTLQVAHSFTWQIDAGPRQQVNVPIENGTHEVIIR